MKKTRSLILKRLFDLLFAVPLFIALMPLLIAIACGSYLYQGLPIFFIQERIGKNGHPFRLFKFRTMSVASASNDSRITVGGDSRITRWGNILRKCKFDELPQLLNVLRGEMSFVGPRPEVDEFVRLYTREQMEVLSIQPGITDMASLKYYDESEQLATAADPLTHYKSVILPDKLNINLEYVRSGTLMTDINLISMTALRVAGLRSPIK